MAKQFHPISELDAKMKPKTLAKARALADIEIARMERKERRKQAVIHFFSRRRVTAAAN